MYSHLQFVDLLTRIARSHDMINSMGFGELADMSHVNLNYTEDLANLQAPAFPLMWGVLKPSSLANTDATTAAVLTKTYTIIICDKYLPAQQNLEEVYSDCEQTALDIIAILQDPSFYPYFYVDKVATLNPFNGLQETDDCAVGWIFDLVFRQTYTSDRCAAPGNIPSPIPIS